MVNLGSKFWQTRWEYRLRFAEEKLFPPKGRALFTAKKRKIKEDVQKALERDPDDPPPHWFWRFSGLYWLRRLYDWAVGTKPSVSLMMTILSALFVAFWLVAFFWSPDNPPDRIRPRDGGHSRQH